MRYLRFKLRPLIMMLITLTTLRMELVRSHVVELVVVHAEVDLRVRRGAVAVDADVVAVAVFKRRP
jgi:hypothetical protein